MGKFTKEYLEELRALPLERKILRTQTLIIEWYSRNEGDVYVSFSGGKDSTVLLDIARKIFPDIEAIFSDTGLEYPEIREFVKTFDNVTWVKPKMKFNEVLVKFGYPIISKEVSQRVYTAKRNINSVRAKKLLGTYIQKDHEKPFTYNNKWAFLVDAPFGIHSHCCNVLKKYPMNKIKKAPIVGTMTNESKLRLQKWLQNGCNAYEGKKVSNPLSFWTEQDILMYLKKYNVDFCSIYGDIIEGEDGELGLTGKQRTGCMFCMYGVHLEKSPNRFELMKITHPKQYEYCMKDVEKGGLGLAKVLDYINVKY